VEGEADAEVDKIVLELTQGILAPASAAPTGPVKKAAGTGAVAEGAAAEVTNHTDTATWIAVTI
jgi:hypothetical protein